MVWAAQQQSKQHLRHTHICKVIYLVLDIITRCVAQQFEAIQPLKIDFI